MRVFDLSPQDSRLNANELENTPPEHIATLLAESVSYPDSATPARKNAISVQEAAKLIASLSDDKQSAVMTQLNTWPPEAQAHKGDFARALYREMGDVSRSC